MDGIERIIALKRMERNVGVHSKMNMINFSVSRISSQNEVRTKKSKQIFSCFDFFYPKKIDPSGLSGGVFEWIADHPFFDLPLYNMVIITINMIAAALTVRRNFSSLIALLDDS